MFAGSGPEEEVEVAPQQPQRLAAAFGYPDVAVGRNRTPDPEHRTLESLVLGDFSKRGQKKKNNFGVKTCC